MSSVNIFKYAIKSNNTTYYCKVVETIINNIVSYSVMFGGKKSYCFIAAMNSSKNYQPYIDRVEYEDDCMMQGDKKGNTVSLVKAALWTIKYLFPHITTFSLTDDSYLYCVKGSKMHKLSLAYDYITKYNQTWYENKFYARLPEDLFARYKNTLSVLDEPICAFEEISNNVRNIHKYKDTYIHSSTPRQFISNLREKYGDRYCIEVGSWLSQYMEYIGINYYTRDWYISSNHLEKPEKYELFTSTQEMKGGKTKRLTKTRKRNNKKYAGYYGMLEFS